MHSKLSCIVAAVAITVVSHPAQAATAFLTFDDRPTGPSLFVDAVPSPQTIVYPQATFTGGVILGNASFFPAQSFATPPNIYGTADFGINLSETLKITIDPSFSTNEVSFPLFNGETFSQSYTVSAFDASNTLLTSHDFLNIPPNTSSGFVVVDLTAAGIASVTITPDGAPTIWDFAIDSVALNESVQSAFAPLPGAFPLFATGLGVLGMLGWRRKRSPSVT